MNKLIKMATIMAGIGAMLSLSGCGSEAEKEYEAVIRATMEGAPAKMVDARVKAALKEFKKMSPAEQQEELKKSKAFMEGAKSEN